MAEIVTVGVGFTLTVIVCGAPPQPLVVSFTVKVVVEAGETIIALVVAPLFHT